MTPALEVLPDPSRVGQLPLTPPPHWLLKEGSSFRVAAHIPEMHEKDIWPMSWECVDSALTLDTRPALTSRPLVLIAMHRAYRHENK